MSLPSNSSRRSAVARIPARRLLSGARRENRRSWRPHAANARIIDPRGARRPGRAGHLPQCRERILRSPGESARSSRFGDRRRPRRDHFRRRMDHRVGRMDQRPDAGQQFKARFLKTSAPSSIEGIEKYLGSGMIRGIGPVYAKKMVKAFVDKVFDIIEAEPARLREVTGIGAVRAKRITDAWADQKIVREIMVFLHSNGVGTARAVRIFKTYGADAVQVMTENPYRLARDIRGIGFKTADAIAMKLGIEKTAMIRVRAGISYALTEAMDDGHCGLPAEELTPLAVELLE